LVIFILINKNSKTDNNENKTKGRLFLYKEDANNTNEINKEKIQVAMSTDNNGIYTTLVSMVSALENNNKEKNILIYHLLLSHNFDMEKIDYFESLKEKYDFRINYYKIPNLFKALRKWGLTNTIYYKLYISMIFPDFDRIIFLDSDTLIFKDIAEMYYLPFNDNYILGYPFHTPWILKRFFKIYPENYINVGVILINIKKIREDNKDFELIDFTFKNTKKLFFPEQDGMNYIFYKKIGLLPLKYGIYLYGNITQFKKNYLRKVKSKIDINEVEKAIEDPTIVHLCCCNPKVWYKRTRHERYYNHICKRFQKEFYFYANKTKYYERIYKKYMKR
jgi:lipopolysaccharide biosynthesis glycosyltransferase